MRIFVAVCVVTLSGTILVAQTDAVKFAEGRVALDNFKDCRAALNAFESIPAGSGTRNDPIYALYMSKAYECVENLDAAVNWYTFFSERVPQTPDVINKLGELRYRLQKQREQSVAREQQRLEEEERAEAARAAAASAVHEKARAAAAAQAELPTHIQRLLSLLNRSWIEPPAKWSSMAARQEAEGKGNHTLRVPASNKCDKFTIHQDRRSEELGTGRDEQRGKWKTIWVQSYSDDVSINLSLVTDVKVEDVSVQNRPVIRLSLSPGALSGEWKAEHDMLRPNNVESQHVDHAADRFKNERSYTIAVDASNGSVEAVASAFKRVVDACRTIAAGR